MQNSPNGMQINTTPNYLIVPPEYDAMGEHRGTIAGPAKREGCYRREPIRQAVASDGVPPDQFNAIVSCAGPASIDGLEYAKLCASMASPQNGQSRSVVMTWPSTLGARHRTPY